MQAYLRLRNCLTSSTDKSKRCSAIKRIGRKMIEGFSRRGTMAHQPRAISDPGRGEHAFRVVKQLWGFAKVRYRGLAKNLPERRPCSPWPTSTKFADNCSRQGEVDPEIWTVG
jgi:hypothetical protein